MINWFKELTNSIKLIPSNFEWGNLNIMEELKPFVYN